MTEPAAILEVRHTRLAEQATLSPASLAEGEEGVFIAHDEPPPVRTVLAVVEGDSRRVLEVVRVVEVADRDDRGTRGFYGRWVGDEALERASKVGTEHLEDGTPVVQPVAPDDSAALRMSDAPVMGMAAPVMMDVDDTGVIDVEDREDADDDAEVDESARTVVYGESAEAGESAGDEASDETAEAEGEGTEESDEAEGSGESEASESSDEASTSNKDSSGTVELESSRGGKRSRGGRRKRGKRRR